MLKGVGLAVRLCGSAAALVWAMNASAQTQSEGASAGTSGLQDIVVTARRVAENLQDVPVAVTAFSGEDLVRQNVQKVQDIQKFTPGLNIRESASSAVAVAITLRGQVQTDNLATLDPSVGTYVDGVYWARAYGLNGDLLDIASVQVLKGPQGTLFGRNTTGGAMIIETNDPDVTATSGRASVLYGRFNEFQANAVLNLPIVSDRLAIRLAGQVSKRDGYVTNISTAATAVPAGSVYLRRYPGLHTGDKYQDRDRYSLRGKVLYQATDNFSLLFSADYYHLDEAAPQRQIFLAATPYAAANTTYSIGGTGAAQAGGGTAAANVGAGLAALNSQAQFLKDRPNLVNNNERPYIFMKAQTYNGTAALDTSFGAIKLIASYRKIRSFGGYDNDGSSAAILITESAQDLQQKSVELQFTGKAFGDRLEFAAGGFVFHESGSDQTVSVTAPLLSPATNHNIGFIDNDSIGLYGQGTFHLTDQFSFTGGLRYSVDDKGLRSLNNSYNRNTGLTTCLLVPGPAFNAGGEVVVVPRCGIFRRDDFDGISYTAGIEYKPNEDILLYAKTAKGFRSGGQNLRAPSPTFFIPFLPETAYSYEVGVKAEFFDRRLRVNLAAYTSDIKNIQRTTLIAAPTGSGTATILGNAGKARIRGIEAEVQAVLFPGFRLSASGALTDPKYVNFRDLSGDRSFERFSNVPEEQFSIAADYTRDVSFGTLDARVDYAWSGKTPLDPYFYAPNPQNAAIVAASTKPAFGQLGARLALGVGEHYEFAVFGRNLTDRRDINASLVIAPLGVVFGSRNEPRTYGVQATAKF